MPACRGIWPLTSQSCRGASSRNDAGPELKPTQTHFTNAARHLLYGQCWLSFNSYLAAGHLGKHFSFETQSACRRFLERPNQPVISLTTCQSGVAQNIFSTVLTHKPTKSSPPVGTERRRPLAFRNGFPQNRFSFWAMTNRTGPPSTPSTDFSSDASPSWRWPSQRLMTAL
jgi:hypothetical protein